MQPEQQIEAGTPSRNRLLGGAALGFGPEAFSMAFCCARSSSGIAC